MRALFRRLTTRECFRAETEGCFCARIPVKSLLQWVPIFAIIAGVQKVTGRRALRWRSRHASGRHIACE